MKVDQTREEIAKAYAGPAWKARVKSMADRQVIAIYKDMERENRLGKRPKENATYKEPDCSQLSIWDFIEKISEKE